MMIASKPITDEGEEPALAITKASRSKQRTPYVVEPNENRVSPEPVSDRSRGTGALGITTATRSKKRSDIVNGPPYVLEAEENRVSPEPVSGRSGDTGALGITTATRTKNRSDIVNEAEDYSATKQSQEQGGWFGGDNDDSEKLVAPADFCGPTADRHVTDVFCAVVLIASWIALTGIGIYALVNGNVNYLTRPLDFDGGICGTNYNNLNRVDYPYLLYTNFFSGGVCVKECPNLTGVTEDGLTDVRTLVTYGGVWQTDGAEIDLSSNNPVIEVADYSNSSDVWFCSNELCFPNNSVVESWNSTGINMGYGFAFYASTTYELFYRCYVTPEAEERLRTLTGTNNSDNDLEFVEDTYSFWNKLFTDLYLARCFIFGFGCCLSLVFSLLYAYLLRIPTLITTVIWTSIGFTIFMFFFGGIYSWRQASEWADQNPQIVTDGAIHATTAFSFILIAVAVFLLLLVCFLRRAIMDAIVCTKEAGRSMNSMVILLLVPVLQTFGFCLFLLPFIYYSANLASLATITTKDVSIGEVSEAFGQPEIAVSFFEFDKFITNSGWYFLFCFLWTGNFIVAMGDLIIALSVSKWYFTKDKSTIGNNTVLESIDDVCLYHFGTAAYGSLLVGIVRAFKSLIARCQKSCQKKAEDTENKCARIVLCCCKCCFWCLACALKFISKHAYIQTALFSTSFCKSCRQSFWLIFRNAHRIAGLTYVSVAVLIIGKLCVSSSVTVLAYYAIVKSIGDELYAVGGPVVITFLISYYVSDMSMAVFDMGISTVLHCFIADEEMHENEDDRYYEKELKDYVDKHCRAE